MIDRTDRRHSGGLMPLLRGTPALLLAILLIMAALAANGGDSPDAAGERGTTRPEATETRVAALATEEAEAGPEPTRSGLLGRVGSGATAEPEATGEAGSTMPKLGGVRDDDAPSSKSVSAGDFNTCGVRSDGSVACWGSLARGVTGDGVESESSESTEEVFAEIHRCGTSRGTGGCPAAWQSAAGPAFPCFQDSTGLCRGP